MQQDTNKPAAQQPPDDENDGKHVQAGAQSDNEPFETKILPDLRKASEDLKGKIGEAKRRNDMPVDSNLGNPDWERSVADGRLDVPDDRDEQ